MRRIARFLFGFRGNHVQGMNLLQLFDEHHAALFRFAYRMSGSAADAEDIVQECFLGLLRPDSRYDAAKAPPRTYLFGAVRNQALKRLRGRSLGNDLSEDVTDGRSPESETMRLELQDVVARAIGQLPEGQREVLLLAHYEQLPLAEIANILGIELGAVKSRLQRARAALKETLASHAPGAGRKP